MISDSLDRAKSSAEFYLGRVREQADACGELTFPAGQAGPKLWLNLVFGLLDTAENHLKKVKITPTDSDNATRFLESTIDCTDLAYFLMERLNGADISEMHYPVVRPMQDWFEALGINHPVLFRANHVANYEIDSIEDEISHLVRDPSPSLSRAIESVDWPFIHVSVPTRAYSILPHFAVVAHEVGHILYENLGEEIYQDIKEECDQGYKNVQERVSTRLEHEFSETEYMQQIFKNWIEELAADAVACYMTGPAILFALSDILQLGPDRQFPSESHPAPRTRLKFLRSGLSKNPHDFAAILKKNKRRIDLDEYFNSCLVIEPPNSNDIYDVFILDKSFTKETAALIAELSVELEQIGEKVYKSVYAYMSKTHSGQIYKPSAFESDLKTFLPPLLQAIPPIESGQTLSDKAPASFVSILNVGWVALLCYLDEFNVRIDAPAHLELGARAEKLHDLLLKAVELSGIRRQWMEAEK